MATTPITSVVDKIKQFYNDENNKSTKLALLFIGGSLIVYTAYIYHKNNYQQPVSYDDKASNPSDQVSYDNKVSNASDQKEEEQYQQTLDISPDIEDEKTKQEDIERKKKLKELEKKRNKEIKRIIDKLLTGLIPDGKGYNIEYFMEYYQNKDGLMKYACNHCQNICRDCVEVENDDDDNKENDDPLVYCEECAKLENKKYTPYKTMRKIILKMNIFLPDPDIPDSLKTFKSLYTGPLSKCINTKIPQMAAEEYKKKEIEAERANIIKLENGQKTDLNWKFRDDSNTKEPLFFISDDGLTAKTNKRSGTILFGPLISAKKWAGKGQWVDDYNYAGNYYEIELKISEADGCGVGFCMKNFNQFVGKNEANISCLMLNQTGWFYTSQQFKHKWEHSRESPMGKWFKSDDVIVIIIDCTDSDNVKGKIYNKDKPENKFQIEKLPKNICVGVNVIVGSNPTGTVQPETSILSQTVVRKLQ